jgi:hypothetical protein
MGISHNLRSLSEYSNKMAEGDYDAVYDYWSDDFFSHVTERVKSRGGWYRRAR